MITATYVTLREHEHSHRQLCIGSDIVLDLDESGHVLGIEHIGGLVDTDTLLKVIWSLSDANDARVTELEQHLSRVRAGNAHFVPDSTDVCDRCKDTNYDAATRICLTCTYPEHPLSYNAAQETNVG